MGSTFSFLDIFDSFWPFSNYSGQTRKQNFSSPFEEFHYLHVKLSLSSLGQASWSCSSIELPAPLATAAEVLPSPLLEGQCLGLTSKGYALRPGTNGASRCFFSDEAFGASLKVVRVKPYVGGKIFSSEIYMLYK